MGNDYMKPLSGGRTHRGDRPKKGLAFVGIELSESKRIEGRKGTPGKGHRKAEGRDACPC